MFRYLLIPLLLLQLPTACQAADAQWGDVKGRFIYRGRAFQIERLESSLINEFCGENLDLKKPHPQIAADGGVGGLLVWLYLEPGAAPPQAHPRYAETPPARPPQLRVVKCQFKPHAFFVRTQLPFEVNLQDGDRPHAEHLTWMANRAGASDTKPSPDEWPLRKHKAHKRERMPIPVTCSYHPWMKAYAIVTDHPYAVQTAADGSFTLKDVPAGVHTFQVRHLVGNGGYVDEVQAGGSKLKWSKGRFRVQVKPGINDVGVVEVQRAVFE